MDLKEKIRYTTIGCDVVNSKKRATKKEEKIPAIIEATLALSDGGWHVATEIREICKQNNVNYDDISRDLKIAQSDNGYFVALLHDDLKDPPEGTMLYKNSLYGKTENYGYNKKQCVNCGESDIYRESKFCPKCGVKFKWQKEK